MISFDGPVDFFLIYGGESIYRIELNIIFITRILLISIGISLILFSAMHWPVKYSIPIALPAIFYSISFILLNQAIDFDIFDLDDPFWIIFSILSSIILIILPLLYISIARLFKKIVSSEKKAAILSIFATSVLFSFIKTFEVINIDLRYSTRSLWGGSVDSEILWFGSRYYPTNYTEFVIKNLPYYLLGFIFVLISYFIVRNIIKKASENRKIANFKG